MTTILVTACGAPGAARLLRALRDNGEREVRLVGVDMSERAIGRHICDEFHLVPPGADPSFPDALLELVEREGVDVVLPESSHDLLHLALRGVSLAAGVGRELRPGEDVEKGEQTRLSPGIGARELAIEREAQGEVCESVLRILG